MIDQDYDKVVEQNPYARAMVQWTAWYTRGRSRILDVGTGTGELAERLAQCKHEVVAIDKYVSAPSHEQVARQRLAGLATLVKKDFLTFEDKPFDAIVSRFSYHHFREKGELIETCKRLLAPDGLLVIGDEFLPELEDARILGDRREERVRLLHEYRSFSAAQGFIPPEPEALQADLTQRDEFKTSVLELSFHLVKHQYSSFVHLVKCRLPLEHARMGYYLIGSRQTECLFRLEQKRQ
jgi:SAM-dependent methyltransferase